MVKIIVFDESRAKETAAFVLGILENEFGLGGVDRPDLRDIRGTYFKGNGRFWLAIDGGKIVGTIALLDVGADRGYLKRMYVDKEFRGKDLAKQLLAHLMSHAIKNGFCEIYLGTIGSMPAANKFYQKEGFEKISVLPNGLPTFGDSVFYKKILKLAQRSWPVRGLRPAPR